MTQAKLELVPPEAKDLAFGFSLATAPTVMLSAGFMSTLAQAEKDVAVLVVNSPQTAKLAAVLQQRLTTAGRSLEDARKEKKEPFLKAGREIDALAAAPAIRITTAKNVLSRALTAWDEVQRREAARIEQARLAEIARLQEVARLEVAEAKRIADELAAKQTEPVEDFDMGLIEPVKTETEKKIEAIQFAPAKVVEKPSGITYKKTLRIKSTNVALLPDAFVIRTANEQAISAGYCVGWKDGQPIPVVPGVEFQIDSQAISSGRSEF